MAVNSVNIRPDHVLGWNAVPADGIVGSGAPYQREGRWIEPQRLVQDHTRVGELGYLPCRTVSTSSKMRRALSGWPARRKQAQVRVLAVVSCPAKSREMISPRSC